MKNDSENKGSMISDVDLAFRILKQRGEPVYFRELIEEILRPKAVPANQWNRAAAAIYTQLNLDTRFNYLGEGRWGLHSGHLAPAVRRVIFIKRFSSKLELPRGSKTRLRLVRGENAGSAARYLELAEWRPKGEEENGDNEEE